MNKEILNKNIKILQLDAKDLLEDFEVKSLRRYKASLDFSLENLVLDVVHRKAFRNNKFVFKHKGKLYTDDVISVTFKYKTDEYGTDELRKKLYDEGFYVNGNHYIRFKRSSGSSRVGKCLFIREEMFSRMMKWSLMGLKYPKDAKVDLASLEAYISLTISSIIDTMEIDPKGILMISDYSSVFKDRVMVTEINSDNRLETYEDEIDVENSIWDGQSLLDSSLFEEKYSDKGMLLLRNRFFKSACFNTNIQDFFRDNGITEISQLNGKTLATDISQIKLITTPSSIKYLKFGTFEDYLSQLEPLFGVVKYDKPTHYFEGELVQTHYQLLNTLEFSKDEMELFLEDTLDYVRLLKQDLSVLRHQIKINIERDLMLNELSTSNDLVYTMLQANDKVKNTNVFINFRRDLVNSYVKNVKKGHVLIKGNYSTLFGNGYEMLLQSIGRFDGKSIFGIDEVINYRFQDGEELVGIRSPHITVGNIWVIKNTRNKFYEKYFNLSKQILCINSIDSNVLERLNGAD